MNESSKLDAKRQQDFDDLQREAAGIDVGRIRRFIHDEETTPEGRRKKREREEFRDRLMEFLADPIYRAKYNGVMEEIHEVRAATERALDQIADQLAGTLTKIQQMEDAAAQLPDGTIVFRDENNIVRRADGSEVEGYLADTIQWTGLEPSFEDYTQKIDERDDLLATQIEVQIYETDVVGAAFDKMTDPDDPPTLDELDKILDNSNTAMPDAVRRHMADVSGEIGPRTSLDSSMIPQLGNT